MEGVQFFEVELSEYKNPDETMREITDFLKDGVEKSRQRFDDPEDDWPPMYIIVLPSGKAALITGTIDKHALVNLVASFAMAAGAVGIGHLNSSWFRKITDGSIPKGSIAGKSGSEEILMLAVYSRTNWQVETALIKRDGKRPPSLDEWTVMMKRDEETEVRGAMFDPLFQALRKN